MGSLKLFQMGRVFHIQDVKKEPLRRENYHYDFVMREVKQKEYFDEIVFSRKVIKHHFPHLYEEALSSSRVLFQNYLPKVVNKDSTASSVSEVRPYTT